MMRTTSFQRMAMTMLAAGALLIAGRALSDTTPDLSGTWRLDRSRSDDPRKIMQGGQGGGGGQRSGGSWGEMKAGERQGEGRGRGAGRGGMRGMARVPELFTLAPSAGSIEMKDSTSALVERIVLADSGKTAPADAKGVPQMSGSWQGQSLQVETTTPNGGKLTQTYALADNGQTLKITTQIQGNADSKRPPMAFTRVYTKVSGT